MSNAILTRLVVAAALVGAVLAVGSAKEDDGDDYDEVSGDDDYGFTSLMKKVSGHKNHHIGHHDHFWHYLALLTIKAKIVFVAVLIALGVGFFFYYGPHKCSCSSPPVHHYGHEYPDRKGRSVDVDLVTRIMEGIAYNYLELESRDTKKDSCKRRLLCELSQLARSQPVLAYTMKLFRSEKWGSEDYNFRSDGIKNCDLLYPDCVW